MSGTIGANRERHPGYRTDAYYGSIITATASSTTAIVANTTYLCPIEVRVGHRFTGIACRVGTAVPGVLGKLALYDNRGGISGVKGLVAAGVGTVDMNATAGDTVGLLFETPMFLAPGFYWGATVFDGLAQPYLMSQAAVYAHGLAPLLGAVSMAGVTGGTAGVPIRFSVASTYAQAWTETLAAPSLNVGTPGSPIVGLIAA
jgi:hypothetical protein